jgi:hypothetical protein
MRPIENFEIVIKSHSFKGGGSTGLGVNNEEMIVPNKMFQLLAIIIDKSNT